MIPPSLIPRRTWFRLLLLLALGLPTCGATEATPEVKRLLSRSLLAKAARGVAPAVATPSATAFTYDEKAPGFVRLVNDLTDDADQRRDLLAVLKQGREAFEKDAGAAGLANDVAAAMALFITTHWGCASGGAAVEDAQVVAFARQLRTALGTEDMKRAADRDKQSLYEWFLGTSILTTAAWEQAKQDNDTAALAALKASAAEALQTLIGVKPADLTFAGQGLAMQGDLAGNPATMAGADGLVPGNLDGGRPSGLFWRFKFDGSSMKADLLCFLPDGRLASQVRLREDGRFDWDAIVAAGYNGTWEVRDGQLTIVRWPNAEPQTAPFAPVRNEKGEWRLKCLGYQWTPLAPPPAHLQGEFKVSASGSSVTTGSSMATGGATNVTTHGAFFGRYVFTVDGRYSTQESAVAMSTGTAKTDGSIDWSGQGGEGAAAAGTYQLQGYALRLRSEAGDRTIPCLRLNDKSLYLGGELYVRQD